MKTSPLRTGLAPLSSLLMLLLFCVPVARAAVPLLRFDFGTRDSLLRPGFTRVTAADLFTPEKGFGFESTRGLQARDRGGATAMLPKDAHSAAVYGASRSTSDITCDFVEGTGDNAFLAALPDGEYTVWLIAGDAAEDPPLFEVWSGGARRLDVRVPRARFVFMEPFQARAVGGQLRLALKGAHGWLLSGLVIGQPGPELAAAVSSLERDIFFLTPQEAPNWKEVKTPPANPPLALTDTERRQGYIAFAADPTEQILPNFIPSRATVGRPLTAFATPGESEPATFGIAAQKDLGTVAVECSDFVEEQTQKKIPRQAVSVGVVRCWPQRVSDNGNKGEYQVLPEMIEPPAGRACIVSAGTLKQWWLTVRVPAETPAGRYRMKLALRPEQAPPTTLEWRLLVLPFTLSRPEGKHWGTWVGGFPPIGGLNGGPRRGRNTPGETDRLVHADLADFREHGFDLTVLNYYFTAHANADGSFSYDLAKLARDLNYLKLLGSNAPVVIGFEYTCRNWEYQFAEPGKKHVPGSFSPKARQAIVGLVKAIHDEAQRQAWPPLYYFPIDEPGNSKTENRMQFAENVLGFVHEVPGCKTATTITASDLQRLGDCIDVRIYAYGHFYRDKVVEEARRGHPFWYYNNAMFYDHNTLASRGYAGFEFLRSGAEVATAWGFADTYGNPYNDFDAGHKDWNVLFPGVDGPTPTIYWELCREGVDDARYVATLQQQIREACQRGKAEPANRAGQVLAPILDPAVKSIDQPLAFGRYRWRIVREILNLMGDGKYSLPFPAVVKNEDGAEKSGPNLIEDPSFEAGPQAEGLPSAGYRIADAYAKPEGKPIGALRVTDEIAHSGRYSLKWDLGKAVGKGMMSGGKRWLVVNVQVPRQAALGLRGKRVRVGYWFRLGGGAMVPGLTLRQSGKGKYLGGVAYTGGVQDPVVWNHFESEGRLREDYESLDIHISCIVPDDELAQKSFFYIDDVSLQAIEEPPLAVSTPLDEYYAGETIPWTATASGPMAPGGELHLELLAGKRLIQEQSPTATHGTLATAGLAPGIYTLQATLHAPGQAALTARREFILAPNPFDWDTPAPYPPSLVIKGIKFQDTTARTLAPGSDIWPLTWAADGYQYTCWGDGGGFGGTDSKGRVSFGVARIEGGKEDYVGVNIAGGRNALHPAPFPGKSEGILALGNTLYLWLNGSGPARFDFDRLYRSDDQGATWKDINVEFSRRGGDFTGSDLGFFAMAFCQFGQGYTGARDNFVYMYAPEIIDTSHWDVQKPGKIALIRVDKAQLDRKSAYRFFAGLDAQKQPRWTSDIRQRQPVWQDAVGGVHRMAVSYNPLLKRYLLSSIGVDRLGYMALYDAPEPWGPWTTVFRERNTERWGSKTILFSFANKWLSPDGKRFVIVHTKDDTWSSIEGQLTLANE